jgi:hypothetical protein
MYTVYFGKSLRARLFVVTLALFGGDAGTGGAANKDAFLEYFGSACADFGEGADNLVGFEFHLAGGIAYMGDFAIGFDIVAGVDRSLEFDHVVCAEETFVAVLFDK